MSETHHPGAFLMKAVAQCGAVDAGASTWYSPPSLDAAERVTEALFLCLSGSHAEISGALIPASTPGGSAHYSRRNLESSSGGGYAASVRRTRRASVSAGSVSHRQARSALSSCVTLVNFQGFHSGRLTDLDTKRSERPQYHKSTEKKKRCMIFLVNEHTCTEPGGVLNFLQRLQ